MVEGEVNVLRIVLGQNVTKRALGPFGFDIVVQLQNRGDQQGNDRDVFYAVKRGHITKDMRSELLTTPKRIPLGAGQVLWLRNENGTDRAISLDYWKRSERPV